jgi:hypothetical protein
VKLFRLRGKSDWAPPWVQNCAKQTPLAR